jgi:hypothetical protein
MLISLQYEGRSVVQLVRWLAVAVSRLFGMTRICERAGLDVGKRAGGRVRPP